jgi:SAM-dependent methyltransferase
MPHHTIDFVTTAAPPLEANERVSRKAAFWDRSARAYAAAPIADVGGYEATMQRVRTFLTGDQDVLEIGCGTGTTALNLAPFTRRLLATDFSPRMIEIAREKLVGCSVPQLSFSFGDADIPAFGQGAFDVVLAFNILHLVNDLDYSLALAVHALRPGGLLISKTPCVAEMNPFIAYLALPLMRAVGKAPHVLCFKGSALQLAFARQGLEVVTVERHGTRGKDTSTFIVARKPVAK